MDDFHLPLSQNGTALTHTPPSAYRAAYHAAALHGQPALFHTLAQINSYNCLESLDFLAVQYA